MRHKECHLLQSLAISGWEINLPLSQGSRALKGSLPLRQGLPHTSLQLHPEPTPPFSKAPTCAKEDTPFQPRAPEDP
jgi:hypothetical protein